MSGSSVCSHGAVQVCLIWLSHGHDTNCINPCLFDFLCDIYVIPRLVHNNMLLTFIIMFTTIAPHFIFRTKNCISCTCVYIVGTSTHAQMPRIYLQAGRVRPGGVGGQGQFDFFVMGGCWGFKTN